MCTGKTCRGRERDGAQGKAGLASTMLPNAGSGGLLTVQIPPTCIVGEGMRDTIGKSRQKILLRSS